MNQVANKQVICDCLLASARTDREIVVLCSDSRGSSSMTPFAQQFPERFVETGIAEQNLVGIAAGLARCGKRPFVASPACFLSTRSLEQVKVDVAYSDTNVKLVGVSGGVSYGALGATHHSLSDIAALSAIPNMRVYLPSDRFLTRALMDRLVRDRAPAYIRVGRSPAADLYDETLSLDMDRAVLAHAGEDVTIIACGETVRPALDAALLLKAEGIGCRVLDMFCLKPIDREAVARAARETRGIVTAEEHSIHGGLGAMVSQIVCAEHPVRVASVAIPDEPAVAGNAREVFEHYGLTAVRLAREARALMGE